MTTHTPLQALIGR